ALVQVAVCAAKRGLELGRMLFHRPRDVEVTEFVGAEVLEVERTLLSRAKLVGEQRVDGPSDDGALDLRARVDSDDRGRVVDRVEVVLPRLLVQRLLAASRPDDRVRVVERRL